MVRCEQSVEGWDEFADGNMFHTQKFLEYHKGNFNWHHLQFFDGRLIAVLPGALEGNTFKSPSGASYGGFIFDCGLEKANECVKALISHCSLLGIKNIQITPPMQIYGTDETQEYALLHNRFTQVYTQYSSIIDVQNVRLDKGRRSDLHRAERDGVTVRESKDFHVLYPILLENKAKYDTSPVHTVEDMQFIDERFDTKLFLAFHKGKCIAGLWVLPVSKSCALIFYSAHLYEYRKYNSIVCIVDHVIRWAAENGYRWLDYGVSTSTEDPNEVQMSLVRFKERLGGQGCLRRTFLRKIL